MAELVFPFAWGLPGRSRRPSRARSFQRIGSCLDKRWGGFAFCFAEPPRRGSTEIDIQARVIRIRFHQPSRSVCGAYFVPDGLR